MTPEVEESLKTLEWINCGHVEDYVHQIALVCQSLRALDAENAELRKDKERLDFLLKNSLRNHNRVFVITTGSELTPR